MKKILSLCLVLAMMLSLAVFSHAANVSTADALVDAFAAGGEIVLTNDIYLIDKPLVIANGVSVTLDLNGHTLSGGFENASSSAIITNNGTFTLKDSVGTGVITMNATNPDTQEVPGYASNAVTNNATMIMTGGTIENKTVNGYATYCVDNLSNVYDASFTMTGG